jgi:hypothetical protein
MANKKNTNSHITEKKMGVWKDGKLVLQTRDRSAVDNLASKLMRDRHSVWVAPIGSFVTV